MPKKREPESAGRAAKLRNNIEQLAGAQSTGASERSDQRPPSPREFIEKRMAELDKKKKT